MIAHEVFKTETDIPAKKIITKPNGALIKNNK
jgi:hypothetical protein